MSRLSLVFVAAVAGVTLAVQLAYAGPSPGADQIVAPRGGLTRTGRMQSADRIITTGLLFLPQVQKELGLSDEQKEKISEECSGPMSPAMGAFQDVQRVNAILKPEQLKRLREISLQSYGGGALRRPDVARELGLTDEQRTEISERLDKRMFEHSAKYRDVPFEQREKKFAEARAEMPKVEQRMMKEALEVLTPEQRKKFDKMTGKKVDFDLSLESVARQMLAPAGRSKKRAWRQIDLLIINHGLLLRPQVQKELGLSDDQAQKVSECSGPWEEQAKRVKEILKPEQIERLREIWVQRQGAGALLQFDVARVLGITDKQTRELGELVNKRIREQQAAMRLPIEEYQKKLAELETERPKLQKRMMEDALKVLTPEQRRTFKKMRGKEMDLDFLRSSH